MRSSWQLELGNDINAANELGNTALHAAAINRLNTVVQFLVDKGARMDVRNAEDQTPLMVAELQRQFAGISTVEEHTQYRRSAPQTGGDQVTVPLPLAFSASRVTSPNESPRRD